MIDVLSKFALEILIDVGGYLNRFTHDVDDFFSPQFKSSIMRCVLKEAFLKANLFNKLQNYLNDKKVNPDTNLIKWNNIFVEKGYPMDLDLNCDIFLEGQTVHRDPNSSNKKNGFREAWIELKFFIPTRYDSAANIDRIANDFLRLCYLTENAKKEVDIELYFIVFVLCGKYKKKYKDIINYCDSKKNMVKLFSLEDDKTNFLVNFNEHLKKNRGNSSFIKKIKRTISILKNEVDLGTINVTRRTLTPNGPSLSSSDIQKNLSGYVFRIDKFTKVKGEIVDLSDEIEKLKEKELKRKIAKSKKELEKLQEQI